MLYSNLGNEKSDMGHIKRSHRPQVPHPYSKDSYYSLVSTKNLSSIGTNLAYEITLTEWLKVPNSH